MTDKPILLWLRRDLRLADHPALHAAAASGRPVIPVVIRDAALDRLGAAARWRMGQALAHFDARLQGLGSRLVLRSGPALEVLRGLVAETGAATILWSRAYDGASVELGRRVKDWAKAHDITAKSYNGSLLFEPWEVTTATGGPYRVFTPFWRAVKDRPVPDPVQAPSQLRPPTHWPDSEILGSWRLSEGVGRGAEVLARHALVGEERARSRFAAFLAGPVARYATDRDMLALPGCSGMSEPLTYGEVSPRLLWHLAQGKPGAEAFLRQLVWRDFAWQLFFHRPDMAEENWREGWDGFPWRGDNAQALAWKQGRSGVPLVDAAMRELYVTGRMHNRARMVSASYLTKHLLTDWRVGLRWFADCLTDWDEAANAMGWQWVAGTGPDAAPFFRVFNPETQAVRFDPEGRYRRRWIAEGEAAPTQTALSYFDAVPRSWALDPKAPRPEPALPLAEGRQRALAAYAAHRT
ncbi:cryptochrome/photolyase family protein [Frigidibacter sp. ROC022]|uniref:cryptochrome/photolyase family protein n=1 Tax=Frigidibacter sp. ROC022 TaxID=2971796 RepID=UPI00215B74E9|nr:deoxyribodipyrimidine photo-lyase [Frigidibacter sp. ROC022]MCR8723601.1 DNA photolyase family protein [Frigidibacter sp. ROC022]